MQQKLLLNTKEINVILHRLVCQLIENHNTFVDTILVGLQPRGVFLANRIIKILQENYQIQNVKFGYLDITFYHL